MASHHAARLKSQRPRAAATELDSSLNTIGFTVGSASVGPGVGAGLGARVVGIGVGTAVGSAVVVVAT
jgi:hypothetical protein